MTFAIALIWAFLIYIGFLHTWHRRSIKALEKQHKEDQEIWDHLQHRLKRLEAISEKFHPHPGIPPPPPMPIGCLKIKGI